MTGARLGFVGLGNIGRPIAVRLTRWPQGLTVFDVSADARATLAEHGAHPAQSPAEVARAADIIGICVVNDDQVRAVLTGPDGLLSSARPGTIIAVHSTISPETATELAASCVDVDATLVDAPISGGAGAAEHGRLAVMVGGPADAVERLREPYAAVSDLLVHAGPQVGAGTRMKLARNLLHFISFTAAGEAARLAEAAGLDLATLGSVVRHTDAITGGAGAIMLRDTTADIAADDFWHDVFTHVRTLGEKDLDLALATAAELGVDLPLGTIARRDLAANLGVPHHVNGDQT